MASAWGGTGGTTLAVLIDGQRFDHLAYGWAVVDFDGPVLLLSQHGVNCGATGSDRCVQALVWTAGKLTGPGDLHPRPRMPLRSDRWGQSEAAS
jgi:hypothetical protein